MANVVAFDTETKGLDWFDPEQQAFIATWADDKGSYLAHGDVDTELSKFLNALRKADIIVAHNFAFDYHQVRATWDFDILTETPAGRSGEIYDTDLMSRILLPDNQRAGRGGHGLKNLASTYITADADEAEETIKKLAQQSKIKLKSVGGYYETWRAYPEELERYAIKDAEYTLALYYMFDEMMGQDDRAYNVFQLEKQTVPILVTAEHEGVALNGEVVSKLKKEFTTKRNELEDYLTTELGDEALVGRGSEDALVEALQNIGVPLHRRTPTGAISTNQFALQEFENDFPQLRALSDWRTASKFLTTYIDPMLDRDAVHCSYRQIGAWTGRMSCTRPNMQNIPKRAGKEVREMFVPREGHVFVVSDYESIEIRLLAHYLNEDGFKELIESGHDPHAWMASKIYGGVMEDYLKGTDGEAQRNVAKNTLFAIVYGAGARRVADMNNIGRDEAKALISSIKSSLPGYRKLNNRVQKKVRTVGYVNTLWGRKNTVPKDKAYVGLNALIQGSAADIMKAGLVNIEEQLGDDGTVLLVVHDEAVVECRAEIAESVKERVEDAMISAYDLSPKLAVEASIVETSYADA